MCGLVVILGRQGQPVPSRFLTAATESLRHRGPDDRGEYFDKNVGFGFRRLSIIDLSAGGHQPMSSADGSLTVVFNGEIYNYLELRTELAALGHVFRSSSDTEVLLKAYRQWGADCVHRFNGMWAFVIHDRNKDALFGARDRMGVKPLYFWQNDDWLVFASEPRAIGATGLATLRPAWSRLAESIVWDLMDHDGGSCIAEVRQVPAAHRFHVARQGSLELDRFWSLPPEPPWREPQPAQDWVDQLGAVITDSLRLRQRSDVPVGFTLSGGLDSSLLICEAARLDTEHAGLLAFSYEDRLFDEREQIRDTVAQTGAQLRSLDDATLDMAALLPEIVAAHGEPVHSMSAVANYGLFGLARQQGVKVVIGGQGADEVLGGYPSVRWDHWHSLADDRRFGALISDVRAHARLHGGSAAATLARTLLRSLRIAAGTTAPYEWLRARIGSAAPATAATRLFSADLLALAPDPTRRGKQFRAAATQREALSHWPLPMYLRIEDRSSMAHSVEARLPFTDYRLVELALRMPDELKYAGGLNKVALRRVAASRVPHSVVSRTHKLGFPVRANAVAAAGLQSLCSELAGTQQFKERGIYDLAAVQRLLSDTGNLAHARVDALFQLAQTELWLSHLSQSPGSDGVRPLP